ncbi:glycosyl hydrolase family 61-domain-containing protein [Aspergillus pseudoustus]|uniref:lytic cellulose monooxygenase (C4-dehydrogenating) n=1 Tax=Aspergillus pseudoustus TaxID=1810923 RepID=A0ABR4KYD8_9EURO
MRWIAPSLVASLALVPSVTAHWNLAALIVDGEVTEDYQYVRRTKNSNSPIKDVTSTDMICNNGGIDDDVLAETETYEVAAGAQVGFQVRDTWGHPGIQQVYLSKAPDTAKGYKGDGDWFKIYSLTTSNVSSEGVAWAPFEDNVGIKDFVFTLPEDLPAGEYLLRGEGLALHTAGSAGGAEFYIGCAQIKVTGSGTGTPGPTVQFPGAYTGEEPGILVNIYYPPLTSYTAPGPAVWPKACEDHTPNTLENGDDGDCTPLSGGAESGSVPSSAPTASIPVTSSTVSVPSSTSTPLPEESNKGGEGCSRRRRRRRHAHSDA